VAPRRISHTPRGGLRPRASGPATNFALPARAFSGEKQLDGDERKRTEEAAEIVAEAVRAKAAEFSHKIPGSVVVKQDEDGYYIRAGGPLAPNAYPFDPPDNPPVYHPNRARKGSKRYEHSKWYAQPYKPFLEAAAEISASKATEAFANVIDDWAKRLGFK
jgi:hypothetical protein